MANTSRQTFHYIGIENEKDFETSLFVFDTNVVSRLSTLRKKGFRLNDPGSVKAAHLLQTLSKHGNPEVSGVLATIEYSGFHSGELNLESIQDCVLAIALTSLPPQILDEWLQSNEPYDIREDELECEINDIICNAENDLWTILLPSYLLALMIHAQNDDSDNRLQHIREILKCFMDLDYFPPIVVPITMLFYCGNTKIRQQLEDRFFKVNSPDKGKQVLSGTWDIAYLSLLRYEELLNPGKTVLVTDDNTLAVLAEAIQAIRSVSNKNYIIVPLQDGQESDANVNALTQYFDLEALNDFMGVYSNLSANRVCETPHFPPIEALLPVIRPLEDTLGIPHLDFNITPSWDILTDSDFQNAIDLVKRRILARGNIPFEHKTFSIYCMIMNLLLADFKDSNNQQAKRAVVEQLQNIANNQVVNDCLTIIDSDFQRNPYSFAARMNNLYDHDKAALITNYLDYIFTSWSSIQGTEKLTDDSVSKTINALESTILLNRSTLQSR